MYQQKIDIILHARYQSILDEFFVGFNQTTQKFTNIRIFLIHTFLNLPNDPRIISRPHPEGVFGNIVRGPILRESLNYGCDVVVEMNDDLWFSQGWMEDCLEKLENNMLVCPGIADTNDRAWFQDCVEKTKHETGSEAYITFACAFFNKKIFKKIGLYDSYFRGVCDDMDMIWRIMLNKVPYAMSRKITVAHQAGSSSTKERNMDIASDWGELYFREKHGYDAHYQVSKWMKNEYKKYFKQFRKL